MRIETNAMKVPNTAKKTIREKGQWQRHANKCTEYTAHMLNVHTNQDDKQRGGGQGVWAFAGGRKRRMCRARTLKALRRLGGACEVDELLASERAKLAEVKGRVDRRHGKRGETECRRLTCDEKGARGSKAARKSGAPAGC